MAQTKDINTSLMALKECIRARTMASAGGADVHVPFRRSKLTLLMKDVFDVGCSRLCSTVVLAACSPLCADVSHTTNTIKYAAPLRVSVSKKVR
jgi:kinesin family protein 2/24